MLNARGPQLQLRRCRADFGRLPDVSRLTRYSGRVSDKDRAILIAATTAEAAEAKAPVPAAGSPSAPPEPAEPGPKADAAAEAPRARREGGPRQNMSEPVRFGNGDDAVTGWTLNMSRGGLRAVVESPLAPGSVVNVTVGEAGVPRQARVVWMHEERGGAVVGLSFLDTPGSAPPPEDSSPGAPPAPEEEEIED